MHVTHSVLFQVVLLLALATFQLLAAATCTSKLSQSRATNCLVCKLSHSSQHKHTPPA